MAHHERPFEFAAVLLPPDAVRNWTAKVADLEDRGYDLLQVPDHVAGRMYGPIAAMTSAAAATTRLRVGTLVLDNELRHPVVLAKELATLDQLSGGRVEMGIGAGWMRDEHERIGLRFDSTAIRIERLEETIDVLQGAWSGGPFSYRGRHHCIDDLAQWPVPVQQPHPPITVGGGGPRLLDLAGRRAQVVNIAVRAGSDGLDLTDGSRTSLLGKLDTVRAAAAVSANPLTLGVNVMAAIRSDLPLADERELQRKRRWPFLVLEGDVDDMTGQLLRWRTEQGISRFTLSSEADLDAFQPIVDRLANR